MKGPARLPLAALLCLGLPASSAEVGLLGDLQFSRGTAIPPWSSPYPGGVGILGGTLDSSRLPGFGLRGAVTLLDLKALAIGLDATWHPEAKGDLKGSWTTFQDLLPPGQTLGHAGKAGTFSTGYWAVGAQADWKFLVDLHAGLEVRAETLKTEMDGTVWPMAGTSTTVYRPWASVGAGYTFPAPVARPFLRLEVAAPLRNDPTVPATTPDDLDRALAPRFQAALYAGVRF